MLFKEIVDGWTDGRRRQRMVSDHNSSPRAFGSCELTKGDKTKSKKGRVVIPVCDMSSGPVLHFCQVSSRYSKGYWSYTADTKSFSNKTKGDNSKSKKARVVKLVCDMSTLPDLHFYQVSSKYSKGYSSY